MLLTFAWRSHSARASSSGIVLTLSFSYIEEENMRTWHLGVRLELRKSGANSIFMLFLASVDKYNFPEIFSHRICSSKTTLPYHGILFLQ